MKRIFENDDIYITIENNTYILKIGNHTHDCFHFDLPPKIENAYHYDKMLNGDIIDCYKLAAICVKNGYDFSKETIGEFLIKHLDK